MKTSFINIVYSVYLALVCFVAGAVLCFSFASMGKDAIVYQFPELNAGYYKQYYHVPEEKGVQLTEEQQKVRYEEELERTQWYALRDIVDALFNFMIALLVFGFHWRLFKHARDKD